MTAKSPNQRRELSKEELIAESKLQTDAIQRLSVWLRLAYSLLAAGFLLAWWGFYSGGGTVAGVAGVVLLVVGGVSSIVLKVGTDHAKTNVRHMMAAAGVNIDEKSDAKADGSKAGSPKKK